MDLKSSPLSAWCCTTSWMSSEIQRSTSQCSQTLYSMWIWYNIAGVSWPSFLILLSGGCGRLISWYGFVSWTGPASETGTIFLWIWICCKCCHLDQIWHWWSLWPQQLWVQFCWVSCFFWMQYLVVGELFLESFVVKHVVHCFVCLEERSPMVWSYTGMIVDGLSLIYHWQKVFHNLDTGLRGGCIMTWVMVWFLVWKWRGCNIMILVMHWFTSSIACNNHWFCLTWNFTI